MYDLKAEQYFKNFIWFILICGCLSACGFHLRGAYGFSPKLQNVYVQYTKQPFDPLLIKMRQSLKESGVVLASDESKASYILQINNVSQASVLQSTNTTNQISTYVLNYTVAFTVTAATGKVIIPTQSVTSGTTYMLNSVSALSNDVEQPELLFGLRQDVIFQMMNRLSSNNAKRAFL